MGPGRVNHKLQRYDAIASFLLQVVFAYIFGMLFFHDRLSAFGICGSVLVAFGVIVVHAHDKPKPAAGAGGTASIAGDAAEKPLLPSANADRSAGNSAMLSKIVEVQLSSAALGSSHHTGVSVTDDGEQRNGGSQHASVQKPADDAYRREVSSLRLSEERSAAAAPR